MQCPTCNVALAMSDRNGIEIDYCPRCRGVWLDRGELDKLIERSNVTGDSDRPQRDQPQQFQQDSQQQRYRDDNDEDDDDDYRHRNNNEHHGQQKKHKKEGFLGDLFDF